MYVLCPVYNAEKYLKNFLFDLKKQRLNNKLILIDSDSTDNTNNIFYEYEYDKKLIKGKSDWWWTKAINEGLKYCLKERKYDDVLLINVDVRFDEDYLEKLVQNRSGNGEIVGSVIYDINNNQPIDLGYYDTNYFIAKSYNYSLEQVKNKIKVPVIKLFGRGTLYNCDIFSKLGFFDESFPQYYADELYSIRALKSGYKLYTIPTAKLYSFSKENMLHRLAREGKIKNLMKFLTSKYSPGNWRIRYLAANRIAPKGQVFSFYIIDMLKHLKRYFTA